jgi:hypothetical protein
VAPVTVAPFFLVIDDGGRPYAGRDPHSEPIGMSHYELVLDLANKFDLTIPIAYTLRYLDHKNASGLGGALDYASDLTDFIRDNKARLPFYHHGLTHGYDYVIDDPLWTGSHAEFFNLDTGTPVPDAQQARHFMLARRVCESQALGTPEAFVPPCHAWEPTVTDRHLADSGISRLITVPRFTFLGRTYDQGQSSYVSVLPRRSLGVSASMTSGQLTEDKLRESGRLLAPTSWRWSLRYFRDLGTHLVHSYYAHITNFDPPAKEFWCRLFEKARHDPRLRFPKSSLEADEMYLNAAAL